MLALVAVFACVSFSSCDAIEEDLGIAEYYCKYSVETNLVDANGNSMTPALMDALKAQAGNDECVVKVGKTNKDKALEWFNATIDNELRTADAMYGGKNLLPEGGWIVYSYSLYSDSSEGARKSASIEITNSGARLL